MNPKLAACVEACNRAHGVTLAAAMNHCLEAGSDHVEPAHFRLLSDAAQACATAADFILRASTYHVPACRLCADVCDACAASCAAVGDMEACVLACRACAARCREVTGDPAPF